MMKARNFLMVLGMVLASGLFSGCGDALMMADACDQDSLCSDDEYCVRGQCALACDNDAECSGPAFCEVFQREGEVDPVQVCLDTSSEDDEGLRCTSDTQCQLILNDSAARCGMHDRCVLVENNDSNDANGSGENQANLNQDSTNNGSNDARVVVIVEQLTADGEALAPADEDGANGDNPMEREPVRSVRLGAVLVRDRDARAIGYGRLLELTPGPMPEASNDEPALASPDPRIPIDDSGTCVESPAEAPYASLGGPGGRAYLDLVDDQLKPIEEEMVQRLEIIGDGEQCLLGPTWSADAPEQAGEYRLHLCVTDTPGLPDEAGCTVANEAPLTGYGDVEVTFDL